MVDYVSEKEGFAALLLRLRAVGIDNRRLLGAFETIPRGLFLASYLREYAYFSRIMPIDCGGFCENIDTLVRLFDKLNLAENHKVFEVGCGSGYSAAVLSRLCERVMTIDRYKTHVENATRSYEHLNLTNIITKQADGSKGIEVEGGIFDRIFITASFMDMPRHYVEHLASGGIMIAPLSLGNGRAKMMRLTKIGSRFEREDLFEVPDSPLISGLAKVL